MDTAYRDRWRAEIAAMRRVLAVLPMHEERKWGKPTYTVDGKNVVILQGFKDYFGLGFFQGALLKDPRRLLVQLGQTHVGRVMNFTSAKDITAKAATIKAYVREAIAVEQAGLRMERKKTSDYPVPEELSERFRRDPRFKRASTGRCRRSSPGEGSWRDADRHPALRGEPIRGAVHVGMRPARQARRPQLL